MNDTVTWIWSETLSPLFGLEFIFLTFLISLAIRASPPEERFERSAIVYGSRKLQSRIFGSKGA